MLGLYHLTFYYNHYLTKMKIQKISFKWISAVFVVLIVAVAVMTTCSSDQEGLLSSDVENPIQPQGLATMGEGSVSDYEELMSALEDYSSAFMSNLSVANKKRSWWSRFKDSVSADFGGASKGGSIFSLGASTMRWNELNQQHTQQMVDAILDDPTKRRKIRHEIDSLKQSYLTNPNNDGALHNAVILQSLFNGELLAETTEQVAQHSLRSLQQLGLSRFATAMNVNELAIDLDDFFAKYYDEDVNIMYDKLSTEFPKRANDFKVLKTYFTNIQSLNSVESIQNYTVGYVSVINSSNLTVNAKEELYRNISIAPASCQLWIEVEELFSE